MRDKNFEDELGRALEDENWPAAIDAAEARLAVAELERDCILLSARYDGKLTVRQIAKALGVPKSTADRMLRTREDTLLFRMAVLQGFVASGQVDERLLELVHSVWIRAEADWRDREQGGQAGHDARLRSQPPA